MKEVTKEDVQFIIKELRFLDYYNKCKDDINEQLYVVAYKLQGVSSTAIKKVVLENARNPYQNNKIELLEQEGELMKERNRYDEAINLIQKVLETIRETSESDYQFIYDACVLRMTDYKISQIHYCHKNSVWDRKVRIIKKALKKQKSRKNV
ncbi:MULTISPECIES: hypothetical protein [unclassified Breznakia]|uniref:hypothetical protein n=1 Tax=unclassified Breznakia TaxID=2623764 RepID=UPI00247314E5|nr:MULTISPECIES: hypothetical protein [unclassified Breznakia]MDH6367146.1 tetratricopeptide (TPR) repeat protein [Breznakia sp. PH1-1]MDH6404267.1 tetratricopeptide (TPR) repeat protein [Breznakia sp. PF1-11]MDH6412034.1 tetratricopeptide (TPR) repeat protein [Breznakia sp. PFB1-11]MDH6414255.1 tetratricopeptide (TPR) repeat protein [Breznakia sp. PFB1-14]MDH6416648.1 tetratricopeptide (TPR) repeat protein [Breznakia sp. PFB1-4]